MSADPAPPSSPTEIVKETTEKSASFLQWVAELIRRRNWFTLLLLIDVALILFCSPGGVVAQFLKSAFSLDLSQQFPSYGSYFWPVVGLIPVIALVMAVRSMPRQTVTDADISERKAIKGLRPFTADDAEIFTRLQRNRSLRECLEAITSENFRFGILMGESGCGKTSFLQAGVVPNLAEPEADYRGVYVRFSDRPPLNAIQDDLAKQLNIPKADLDSADLVTLLQTAVAAIDKPLILFFDQFEQFFVHASRKPDRQPFIQALTAWYHSDLPVRVLVCMRGDMVDRLVELHQALGYALSPQEVFRLEKFSPEEATKVLQVIAETEKLRFEESFVRELAERELADREDGAISPVDLQILGWMIERQNADELRAFNQQAFQKFGGVEGLMTRFLEKTLEARVIKSQRETAVKVLLALTDLDRNVRAGALSLTALQDKLKDTVKADEVTEAVRWLVRGDVRLVTPEEKAEETVYELAHERLIPAVRKVAGQELTEVQKANELLDRRANEWQGNQFSSRYLFSSVELWQLKRQQPYLEWGTNRRQKERLWQKSWRRLYRTVGALALVLLVLLSGWGWLLSPSGQRWQMRRELAEVSQKVTVYYRQEAALAFAKDGNQEQVDKILDSIQISHHRAIALSAIAEVHARLNKTNLARELLDQANTRTDQIQDPYQKVYALSSLAKAFDKLDNRPLANSLLKQAYTLADQIQDVSNKAYALQSIAEAHDKLNEPQSAKIVLERASISADKELDPYTKSNVLWSLLDTSDKLNELPLAKTMLEQAYINADQMLDPYFKAYALSLIIEQYGKFDEPQLARTKLAQLRASANRIKDSYNKALALSSIDILTSVAENSDTPNLGGSTLEKIHVSADQIQDPFIKAAIIRLILDQYDKLDEPQSIIKTGLARLRRSTDQIQNPSALIEVLPLIAKTQAKLGDWQQSNLTASQCTSHECTVEVLSTVLTVWAERQHPELAEVEEE